MAGEGRVSDPYFQHLLRLVRRLRLRGRVIITGLVTDAELSACYQSAHLFLSPSEHEGFGVPLVEAMWFDVPVLAARAGAVPETLAGAGVLFDPGEDLREVARLAKLLARDDAALRRGVVEAQRARREAFTPAAVRPVLEALLRRMAASAAETQTAAA
ncbi:MAG: glycosyltransferase [Acidobacteria bacterium]|nr:glycosyltransferase [Acidobacteriota bacterium]